jgi:predicted RNA-binding protein with PIN domain
MGLAEPLRQRLIQVAAEVLGRLPVEQVPSALRSIARFTPAKRQRLGGVAIAAALDTDETFRETVAEAVAEVSAGILAGAREHDPLQVTDPIDAAAVAYLTRSDGWAELVAEATARWRAERAPRDAAVEESARLRRELAEARSQLKSAEVRARQAQARLGEQQDESPNAAEIARLTKELRGRTGELRAAERERDAARAELVAAHEAATTAEQNHAAEVQSLSGRVQEAQRTAEAGRRSVRADRELDDARLRMLLETVTDAAAGIRRELSLPASTLRPADAVAANGAAAGATRGADDAAGLERLLGMPQVHLIVDGYNVTKTGYGDMPLADQRARVVSALAAWCARSGVEATVAFDGGARPAALPRTPRGVRVLFSAEDEIADDLIRRLVAAEPPGRPVVVVTSDEQVISDVRAAGAFTAPARALLGLLG